MIRFIKKKSDSFEPVTKMINTFSTLLSKKCQAIPYAQRWGTYIEVS